MLADAPVLLHCQDVVKHFDISGGLLDQLRFQGGRPRRVRTIVRAVNRVSLDVRQGETLAQARIEAELVIVPTENPIEAVRQAMQPSAILFTGFEPPEEEDPAGLISDLQHTVDLPGDIMLIYNAGDVSLQA